MSLPKGFLDELKGRIRVSEVVGRKVKLIRRGREFVGLSPFTNEKSPSFTVNDDKQFYHCFSSGEHGDVIKFLEKTENLSFIEAVERLAAEAGMEMPERDPFAAERDKEAATLIDVMEMAAQFFRQKLAEGAGAEARAYLERRGLKGKTIDDFGIGYAPGDDRSDRTSLLKYLKSKNVTLDQMAEAGLVIAGADIAEPYDRFRNRVMFPIADARGRVIAFGGRALSPDAKAKYLNSPETPLFHKGRVLYNLARARKPAHDEGTVIAVEGYMDVVGLAQGGIHNAVAPLGTALTEDQIALLWRMTPEPILCFDGDKAGLRAAYRAVERVLPMLKPGHSLRFALLPEGKDPDDLVREEGGDAMRDILARARPLSDMLWEKETSTGAWDTPERRAKLEADLEAAVAAIGDPKVRAHYAQALRERVSKFFGGGRRAASQGGYGRGRFQQRGFRNRPFREKGFFRGDAYTPPATPQLKQSSLVTGRECPSAWEDMFLAVLLDYPALVIGQAEEIAVMPFCDVERRRLRDAVLDFVSAEESAPEPDVLRERLSNAGFRGALQALNERILSDRSGLFKSLKSFERAEQCIAEILTAKSRSIRLLSEIKAAEEALARDMSDENFHRLRALMLESRCL